MNNIINKLLLAGDKFMSEMHLRFTWLFAWTYIYMVCGSFTKNKTRIQKFKETWDSRCIYRNELEKACLQHDMEYRVSKDPNV